MVQTTTTRINWRNVHILIYTYTEQKLKNSNLAVACKVRVTMICNLRLKTWPSQDALHYSKYTQWSAEKLWPSVGTVLENGAKVREFICKDHRQESMTFARLWDCHMGHASAFCQTNLTGGRLLQNSCQGCWLTTRSNIGWKSAWN